MHLHSCFAWAQQSPFQEHPCSPEKSGHLHRAALGCRDGLAMSWTVILFCLSFHAPREWTVFTNTRISCTMWLVKPFFKNMWAGPLSTTSLINNLLPGCCVDKLSSFHHPCHPHLLPSPTHTASPRTSKFIYQAFLRGGRWAGGRKEESDCSKNQSHELKPNPFLLHSGTHRN